MFAVGVKRADGDCYVLDRRAKLVSSAHKAHLFHSYLGALQFCQLFSVEEYYVIHPIDVSWRISVRVGDRFYYLREDFRLTPHESQALDVKFQPDLKLLAKHFRVNCREIKITYGYELLV